jgi:hypothetical protein
LDEGSPHPTRLFAAFHRQMAVFRELMLEMHSKYKMLWFFVDMYQGQRYFFICGCHKPVMKIGVDRANPE